MTTEEIIEYWEQFSAEIDDLYNTCSDAERSILEKQREVVEFTISAIRELGAKEKPFGEWISVKDRLPETGERVLTLDKWGHIRDRELFRFKSGFICFRPDGLVPVKDITHWMPLPGEPEEEQ